MFRVTGSRDSDFFRTKEDVRKSQSQPGTIIGLRLNASLRLSTSYYSHSSADKRTLEPFNGIFGSLGSYIFVLRKPPIISLSYKDLVPGTNYCVNFGASCELDERSLARLQWAFKFKQELPIKREPLVSCESDFNVLFDKLISWNTYLTSDGVNGKPSPDFKASLIFPEMTSFLIPLILYGALHALAFGIPFHSNVETLLWKISCLTVLGSGFITLAITLIGFASGDKFKRLEEGRVSQTKNRALRWCLLTLRLSLGIVAVIIGGACYWLYAGSRVFLAVEGFLNLPYVDSGLYQTPNWSIYWPHIS